MARQRRSPSRSPNRSWKSRSTTSSGRTPRSPTAHGVSPSSRRIQRYEADNSLNPHAFELRPARCLAALKKEGRANTWLLPDHQALRSRAPHQIRRRRRCRPAGPRRLPPARHARSLVEVPGDRLRRRRHSEPEPLPCHPRNLAQPGLPLATGQPPARHLCEPAHRHTLQRVLPGMIPPPSSQSVSNANCS